MIIDVSAFQGVVDWRTVLSSQQIERVIFRSTTKNGNLDTRFMENFNGLIKNGYSGVFDVYKFAYSKTYDSALIEAKKALETLNNKGVMRAIDTFWLDLENVDGVRFSKGQAAQVIGAYRIMCEVYKKRFGIYANYDYVKNVLPEWASIYPLWLARYNNITGDVKPFNIEMWQYTSNGNVKGITGAVDLSRYVRGGNV